jgi:cell division protein FtsI (penicillin-binding protein 3)
MKSVAASTPRNGTHARLYLLGGILLLWFCAICLRLVYLQIFQYGTFELRAQHQQQRTTDVAPKRGIIYDRTGRELAMSVSVDSAFAVPTEIPDLGGALSLVARITKADPRELLAKCKAGRTFCWVARKADAETARRLRELNLRGIYFQKESKRYYPNRDLAAQILGYVGTDDEGLSGIEREYNDELHGKAGSMIISVDARRKWFGSVEKQPEPGQNVVLTIDQQIQYIAEKELDVAIDQTRAISGTVVVQNPRTGEILALANDPRFNPNVRREITPERLRDHAVSDVYEPGSTFKLVTLSAAIDSRLTRPEEIFDCQMGSIVINGRRIHDWHPFGMLSVADILAHSSDVGAIKVALRLGDDRLYKYIRAYGFGSQTGIELPAETRGLVKPVERWSKVSIGAISMGQEIGVSPLQLAAMVSTIANDGVRLPAHIVAGTTQPRNTPQLIAFHPGEGERVIAPLTAAEMKQMMQGVVLHGTGRKAILDGYSSAGKTGTAQKIDPATRTYSHTKYIASFAGFAPVNNPAITVVVILDSPMNGHHGGEVGAPVFNRIAQQVLEYLHTPHDVEIPENRQLLLARKVKDQDLEDGSPDRLGDTVDLADAASGESKPAAAPLPAKPSPEVASQAVVPAALRSGEAFPAPGSSNALTRGAPVAKADPLPANGTVVLDVEQGGIVVPSFLGQSVRSAVETAENSGLEIDAVGDGLAREQSLPAGSHVTAGTTVTVKFAR